MPGLIAVHIHLVLTEVNLQMLADVPLTLLAAKGSVAMRAMLERGFTTLRDTGGADWGLKAAVEQGLFVDLGCSSPASRSVEHGNLIDVPTAALMAERGAFLVPTLVTYDAMRRRGRDFGLSSYSLAKNEVVLEAGMRSLETARDAGVKIGFGSDLLGQLQDDHCGEFMLRGEAMSAPEVIRSATLVNAEIVRHVGKLGELVPGAFADLLVVDGNPFQDLGVFRSDGRRLDGIMVDGRFVRNRL
jgi:imidazolonepropionase-like amidohydrolase